MKRTLLALLASMTPLFAELPQMSDKTEWLGYFVGWESSKSDFGVGADGEVIFHPKKSGKRAGHKEIRIDYIVEEDAGGRWVRRQLLKEGGLESSNEKGIDPKKPVVVTTTVTGGIKIEWTHMVSRGKVNMMPKVVANPGGNKIRVGLKYALPRLYAFEEEPTPRDLKKKLGADYIKAMRLKDRKNVRVKFKDLEDDITSDEFLADGASQLELKSNGIMGNTFIIQNGQEKVGRIDVKPRGPLYKSFSMTWMADMEKIGTKDCFVTFWVK